MGYLLKKLSNEPTNYIYTDSSQYNTQNYYPISPVMGFSFDNSIDKGSSVKFTTLETTLELNRGDFIQIYHHLNEEQPVAVFQLTAYRHKYVGNNDYYYECEGESYHSLFANGIVLKLKFGRVKFKDLCIKIAQEIKKQHPAFSDTGIYIDDIDYEFTDFTTKTSADKILKYLYNRGFILYYDNFLQLHASSLTLAEQEYTLLEQIDINKYKINTLDNVNINSKFYYKNSGVMFKVLDIDSINNIITIDYENGLDLTIPVIRSSKYIIDLDAISPSNMIACEQELYWEYEDAPYSNFIITADGVTSDIELTQEFVSDGNLEQPFVLNAQPGDIITTIVELDKQEPFELDEAPLTGTDLIELGRLKINYDINSNFSTNYRNWKQAVNGTGGVTFGGSFYIEQTTGNLALLGIKQSKSDPVSSWIGGFVVKDTQLGLVVNGQTNYTDYFLQPTLESDITNIIVTDILVASNTGYEVGGTVYFSVNGENVNFATITQLVGNNIVRIDKTIAFETGMELKQINTYILKWTYYDNNIIFFVERGGDNRFKNLGRFAVSFNQLMYLQVYANQKHKASIDFLSATENLNIKIIYENKLGATRALDVAYEEASSVLRSEVKIYSEDGKYKFMIDDVNEDLSNIDNDLYIITGINAPGNYQLYDAVGLVEGMRILIKKQSTYITYVNIDNKVIYTSDALVDIQINDSFFVTEIFPSQNEKIIATYRALEKASIKLCSDSFSGDCGLSIANTTKYVSISIPKNTDYELFRALAEAEVAKSCKRQLTGTMTLIFSCDGSIERKMQYLPYAGDIIKFYSANNKKIFNNQESIITAVSLSPLGDEGLLESKIQIGTVKDNVYLLSLIMPDTSELIDDTIPDDDLLCTIKEYVHTSITSIDFENVASFSHRNGRYRQNINGLLNKTLNEPVFTIYDGIQLKNINGLARCWINGLR